MFERVRACVREREREREKERENNMGVEMNESSWM